MCVVVRVPVVMVAVIEVPVMWCPGMPVNGVVAPVPWRTPYHIGRPVDVNDYRPACYFVISGFHNANIATGVYLLFGNNTGISGVGCFGVSRFNDIVGAVERFITDKLNMHRPTTHFFNNKYSYILKFVLIQRNPERYVVNVSVNVVVYHDVVNIAVAVQVKVVDHVFGVVEFAFKTFQCLRLLEKVHHCVEVKVIAGQSEVFFGPVLRLQCAAHSDQ